MRIYVCGRRAEYTPYPHPHPRAHSRPARNCWCLLFCFGYKLHLLLLSQCAVIWREKRGATMGVLLLLLILLLLLRAQFASGGTASEDGQQQAAIGITNAIAIAGAFKCILCAWAINSGAFNVCFCMLKPQISA